MRSDKTPLFSLPGGDEGTVGTTESVGSGVGDADDVVSSVGVGVNVGLVSVVVGVMLTVEVSSVVGVVDVVSVMPNCTKSE